MHNCLHRWLVGAMLRRWQEWHLQEGALLGVPGAELVEVADDEVPLPGQLVRLQVLAPLQHQHAQLPCRRVLLHLVSPVLHSSPT